MTTLLPYSKQLFVRHLFSSRSMMQARITSLTETTVTFTDEINEYTLPLTAFSVPPSLHDRIVIEGAIIPTQQMDAPLSPPIANALLREILTPSSPTA